MDILQELEKDIKRERFEGAVKKYYPLMILIFILIIGGTGVGVYINGQQEQARQEATAQIASYADEYTAKVLQPYADSHEGREAIANLYVAASHEKESPQKAYEIYQSIAKLTKYEFIADYAMLRSAYLSALQYEETGNYMESDDAMRGRMEYLSREGGVLRFMAMELDAGLSLQRGNRQEALAKLRVMMEPQSDAQLIAAPMPESQRMRVKEMIEALEYGVPTMK